MWSGLVWSGLVWGGVSAGQGGLELSVSEDDRHLLIFLPGAGTGGMHHHAEFMRSAGSNPGLHACQASTLPTLPPMTGSPYVPWAAQHS